jgi:hypothetical protein
MTSEEKYANDITTIKRNDWLTDFVIDLCGDVVGLDDELILWVSFHGTRNYQRKSN